MKPHQSRSHVWGRWTSLLPPFTANHDDMFLFSSLRILLLLNVLVALDWKQANSYINQRMRKKRVNSIFACGSHTHSHLLQHCISSFTFFFSVYLYPDERTGIEVELTFNAINNIPTKLHTQEKNSVFLQPELLCKYVHDSLILTLREPNVPESGSENQRETNNFWSLEIDWPQMVCLKCKRRDKYLG